MPCDQVRKVVQRKKPVIQEQVQHVPKVGCKTLLWQLLWQAGHPISSDEANRA